MHTTIKYNCSPRLVISIVIKLGKTLNKCPYGCKNDKFVHRSIFLVFFFNFCAYPSI